MNKHIKYLLIGLITIGIFYALITLFEKVVLTILVLFIAGFLAWGLGFVLHEVGDWNLKFKFRSWKIRRAKNEK